MSGPSILTHGSWVYRPSFRPNASQQRRLRHLSCFSVRCRLFNEDNKHKVFAHLSRSLSFRIRCQDSENQRGTVSEDSVGEQFRIVDKVHENGKSTKTGMEISFLAKIAIALGIAVTVTLICIGIKQPGTSLGFHMFAEKSSSSAMTTDPVGFDFKAFGYRIILPEYAPGWIYFWLLMAAGCGLFISEEALNIWVGITLSRMLTLDGTWQSFAESFSRNASYILSTVLWVYWGVCISDLVPFYLGKIFRQSGASDDVCSKLGIDKERAMTITDAVQKYGNLIGLVERFSLGVRNPTAFLAGALGISADCFFAGVCCGGLITLPLQHNWG